MKTIYLNSKPVAQAVGSNRWLGALRVLFTPSCWIQNQPYSKGWDAELRRLLATQKFEPIDSFTAKIGDWEVWIENHPYASFTIHNGRYPRVRPSRATILAAGDKLMADLCT